ncbi:gamma-glutamylcyclotransferase family protein [Tellurirhabdus bombi]|uniref:gamma-glutamylcyclotransferase family protein n=1 Tax=Tellurirhabdus bombi TaxID=2907205 RepID=UPI001F33480C|nr:gamma-glutamylcyclotransferase family protein [Tellurirhabdus bombi]
MSTAITITTHLLVYGTLQQTSNHPMANYLHGNSTFLGKGYFSGQLYQLGDYPGARYDPEAKSFVHGEIYALNNPDEIFAVLDRYEGIGETDSDEYVRQVIPVQSETGRLFCWVYLYNQSTQDLSIIDSGKYQV